MIKLFVKLTSAYMQLGASYKKVDTVLTLGKQFDKGVAFPQFYLEGVSAIFTKCPEYVSKCSDALLVVRGIMFLVVDRLKQVLSIANAGELALKCQYMTHFSLFHCKYYFFFFANNLENATLCNSYNFSVNPLH